MGKVRRRQICFKVNVGMVYILDGGVKVQCLVLVFIGYLGNMDLIMNIDIILVSRRMEIKDNGIIRCVIIEIVFLSCLDQKFLGL